MSHVGQAGKKRPRMTEESSMEQAGEEKRIATPSNRLSTDTICLPAPIRRLRLEAIFHPKFENEDRSDQTIRNSMTERVEKMLGYLEVTLKHSGSLVLWSGNQRYYSKNSMDNQFTYTAEILVRQHFERAWRRDTPNGDIESRYEECSGFLQENRLTLAFEVVTSVLGDHGDRPKKDFVILTAVADRSQGRFYTTTEVLQLAQRFRLPHNDSWMFTSVESVNALFQLYDTTRETGLATDTVKKLTSFAEAHVPSMYQHDQFQGEILEGIIIRYVPYTKNQNKEQAKLLMDQLASQASDFLTNLPADLPPSFQVRTNGDKEGSAVLSTDIRELSKSAGGFSRWDTEDNKFEQSLARVLANGGTRQKFRKFADKSIDLPSLTKHLIGSEDGETRRIAQLLQRVSELNKPVGYFIAKEESPNGQGSRWLCVLHVYDDQTFRRYHEEISPGAMKLFRGFCIEIGGEAIDANEKTGGRADIVSSRGPENDETPDDVLMLKMKFLPYMTRTFICRNKLRMIQKEGTLKFNGLVEDLLNRWGISAPRKKKWIPFLQSWAMFAQSCLNSPGDDDSLPPLTESNYLDYLEVFSELYKSGKAPNPDLRYAGTVVVVSPVEDNAKAAAQLISSRLEAGLAELTPDSLYYPGHVCYTCVLDKIHKQVRKALSKICDRLTVVLLGFGDVDIKSQLADEGNQNKAIKFGNSWRGYESAETIEMDLSLISGLEKEKSSKDLDEAIKKMYAVVRTDFDEKSRGMLVFFPGLPGWGKSAILKSMQSKIEEAFSKRRDSSKESVRAIHVLEGDEMGKTYWNFIKKTRRKDTRCIVIADKNTPPPSLRMVGSQCCDTNAIPVAVIPDSSALQTTHVKGATFPDGSASPDTSHFYPFSLEFLAVCMARVLGRPKNSHSGKLDAGTPNACMVVILFYSLYRSISAEEFARTVESRVASSGCIACSKPIVLPFRSALSNKHVPIDLQEILKEALQLQRGYDIQKKRAKAADKVMLDMEKRIRRCVQDHSETLSKIAVDQDEAGQKFLEQIVDRISALNDDPEAYQQIKLAAIDFDKKNIHQILMDHRDDVTADFLKMALGAIDDVGIRDGCYTGTNFIARPHITLAHYNDTSQSEMKDGFSHLQGCTLKTTVTGFLWNESVAAFCVEVDDKTLDEQPMPRPRNEFVHITVWIADGAEAFLSNTLPSQVVNKKASRVDFVDPICVTGTVAFWDMANTPLTIQTS
eukprot:scaffold683_cov124-Cylindrotheca_fusiformis.AAC.24